MTAGPESETSSGDRGPLSARVEDAIAELDELRSSDPAARSAVHAIKLTQLTLESFWARTAARPE